MAAEEGSGGGGGGRDMKSSPAPTKSGGGGAANFLAGMPSRGNFSSGSVSSSLVRTLPLKIPKRFYLRAFSGVSIRTARSILKLLFWLSSAQGGFRVYVCEHSTDPPGVLE
nr:unnamed protein product [Digitaria exilis]